MDIIQLNDLEKPVRGSRLRVATRVVSNLARAFIRAIPRFVVQLTQIHLKIATPSTINAVGKNSVNVNVSLVAPLLLTFTALIVTHFI